MGVGRVLNAGLLLGLGASLAVAVPRLWRSAAPAKSPDPVVAAPVPAPSPPPAYGPEPRSLALNAQLTEACLERLRQANPSRDKRPVMLRINIGISGRVKHIGLSPSGRKSPQLVPCVRDEVGRWTFPPSDEEHGLELALLPSIQPRAVSALLRGLPECGWHTPTKAGSGRVQ
jgi:hypothetical protein